MTGLIKTILSLSFILFLVIIIIPSEGYPSLLLIHLIDVGYGDAIVIRFPDGKNMLIDTGREEMGERVINHLNRLGVSRLNILVITHLHPDHVGALGMILEKIDTDNIVMAQSPSKLKRDIVRSIREKGINLRIVKRGDKISLSDEVEIDILHPLELTNNPNDNSIVIRLIHKDMVILFTGDIGPPVQKELIDIFGKGLRSHLLKVPHHGGGDNTEDFIKAVSPAIVLISVGPSKYHAPDPSVIDTYKDIGARVMRTDIEGTIVIASDGANIRIANREEGGNID